MADDALSFPTAIVPTRPSGSAVERARKYMRAFGDPMGVLFTDMKTATRTREIYGEDGEVIGVEEYPDREVRRECAKELMPYIYPKLRASEVNLGAGGSGGGGVSITINIGGPPAVQDPVPAAIDITPSSPPEDDPLA